MAVECRRYCGIVRPTLATDYFAGQHYEKLSISISHCHELDFYCEFNHGIRWEWNHLISMLSILASLEYWSLSDVIFQYIFRTDVSMVALMIACGSSFTCLHEHTSPTHSIRQHNYTEDEFYRKIELNSWQFVNNSHLILFELVISNRKSNKKTLMKNKEGNIPGTV